MLFRIYNLSLSRLIRLLIFLLSCDNSVAKLPAVAAFGTPRAPAPRPSACVPTPIADPATPPSL